MPFQSRGGRGYNTYRQMMIRERVPSVGLPRCLQPQDPETYIKMQVSYQPMVSRQEEQDREQEKHSLVQHLTQQLNSKFLKKKENHYSCLNQESLDHSSPLPSDSPSSSLSYQEYQVPCQCYHTCQDNYPPLARQVSPFQEKSFIKVGMNGHPISQHSRRDCRRDCQRRERSIQKLAEQVTVIEGDKNKLAQELRCVDKRLEREIKMRNQEMEEWKQKYYLCKKEARTQTIYAHELKVTFEEKQIEMKKEIARLESLNKRMSRRVSGGIPSGHEPPRTPKQSKSIEQMKEVKVKYEWRINNLIQDSERMGGKLKEVEAKYHQLKTLLQKEREEKMVSDREYKETLNKVQVQNALLKTEITHIKEQERVVQSAESVPEQTNQRFKQILIQHQERIQELQRELKDQEDIHRGREEELIQEIKETQFKAQKTILQFQSRTNTALNAQIKEVKADYEEQIKCLNDEMDCLKRYISEEPLKSLRQFSEVRKNDTISHLKRQVEELKLRVLSQNGEIDAIEQQNQRLRLQIESHYLQKQFEMSQLLREQKRENRENGGIPQQDSDGMDLCVSRYQKVIIPKVPTTDTEVQTQFNIVIQRQGEIELCLSLSNLPVDSHMRSDKGFKQDTGNINRVIEELKGEKGELLKTIEGLEEEKVELREYITKQSEQYELMMRSEKELLQGQILKLRHENEEKDRECRSLFGESETIRRKLCETEGRLSETASSTMKQYGQQTITSQKQLIEVLKLEITTKSIQNLEMRSAIEVYNESLFARVGFIHRISDILNVKREEYGKYQELNQIIQNISSITFRDLQELQQVIVLFENETVRQLAHTLSCNNEEKQILLREIESTKYTSNQRERMLDEQILLLKSGGDSNACVDKMIELQKSLRLVEAQRDRFKASYNEAMIKFNQMKGKYQDLLGVFERVGRGIEQDLEGSLMRSNAFEGVEIDAMYSEGNGRQLVAVKKESVTTSRKQSLLNPVLPLQKEENQTIFHQGVEMRPKPVHELRAGVVVTEFK